MFNKIEELWDHHIYIPFFKYKEMLSRMLFWGWKMRWNWDFDANSIYEIMYYKLDRLYICFRDNGHCVWTEIDNRRMRDLRITRELAKRLWEDDYNTHEKIHAKKWGEYDLDNKCETLEDGTPRDILTRTKVKTKIQQKQQRKEFIRSFKRDDKQKEFEKAYFFRLLEKNINRWWD